MPRLILFMIACLAASSVVHARPLITNSEDTYESACLAYNDSPERMVEICKRALESTGASDAERLEMKDSLAWAHNALGNVDLAEKHFRNMLDMNATSHKALNGLAWILFDRGDHGAAAELFERSLAAKPSEQSLAGLGSSLFRTGQISFKEATTYLDAAVAITPEYNWALREKGWFAIQEDQFDIAFDAFQTVLARDPSDAGAAYGRAYIHTQRDEWREGLRFVNRALQEDPEYIAALSRRSLILLELGRPAQALIDGERIIELVPNSSDGYVRVARAQVSLGRSKDANATLARAAEVVGYESYLAYWQAELLYDSNDFDAALIALEQIFSHEESDYFDHELKVQILLEMQRYEGARAALDIAIPSFPQEPWLLFYDALTLVGERHYDAAEERFDDAIAAELPEGELSYFLEQLVGASRYVQAIKMRLRYSGGSN